MVGQEISVYTKMKEHGEGCYEPNLIWNTAKTTTILFFSLETRRAELVNFFGSLERSHAVESSK